MKILAILTAAFVLTTGTAYAQSADAGVFLGAIGTRNISDHPSDQPFWGVFAGYGKPIGIEAEFMKAPYKEQTNFGFRIVSLSVYAQTPPIIGPIKIYGAGGTSMIWTTSGLFTSMVTGINYGGGIRASINDIFGLRADVRMFTVRGYGFEPVLIRAYAGLNVEF